MSLFQPFPTTSNDVGFAPLFRFLDDYDVHRSSRDSQSGLSAPSYTRSPRFDVRETKESYNLDGELPGTLQKDIEIEFSDPQTLIMKGTSEREYHTPDSNDDSDLGHRYWVSERSTGEFQRSFKFPTRVDQDAVKASLRNGILSVTVPKATAPTPKKITVE